MPEYARECASRLEPHEPWPIVFHLGAGKGQGIAVGQAVLAPEGLVGRITRVDHATASASILSDPNAPVACQVVGSGVRGVLKFRFDRHSSSSPPKSNSMRNWAFPRPAEGCRLLPAENAGATWARTLCGWPGLRDLVPPPGPSDRSRSAGAEA